MTSVASDAALGAAVRSAIERVRRIAKMSDPTEFETSYAAQVGLPDGSWWAITLAPAVAP